MDLHIGPLEDQKKEAEIRDQKAVVSENVRERERRVRSSSCASISESRAPPLFPTSALILSHMETEYEYNNRSAYSIWLQGSLLYLFLLYA
jgi:hypothetical protein